MNIILLTFFFVILFFILGYGADLVIFNLKEIGKALGLKIFFLGIILGIITSLPELAVGFNAVVKDIPGISAGNLFGGIIVLLSLILGLNIVFNREITTDGKIFNLFSFFVLIILAILLSLDGVIGVVDGVILMLVYLFSVWFLYKKNKPNINYSVEMISQKKIYQEIFFIAVGLVLIIVSSGLIIRLAEDILEFFKVSPFLIGIIFFSLGTNLPEITVSFKAWRNKNTELSISNLLGSGAANIFILGLLASIQKINIEINKEFYLLIFTVALILALFAIFYRTGKRFSFFEGLVFLGVYILFILSHFIFFI
ncbi:MAG: hypothetical protein PHT84_05120 [Candidatus Pacebacteria bacterium]|jgi:cation:H+ antiporter|nr:hypothetical protein [Candidatus Paceibacterota bacterium]